MALTKADFAEQLFDELGLKKHEGKDIVELFFEEIKRTLEQGEPVKISGYMVTLHSATKSAVRVETPKQAKKSRLRPGEL